MELRNPYPAIDAGSFGGDQRRSADPVMRRCGCGVIAATDLLLYLGRYHPGCALPSLTALGDEALTQERYDALTRRLRRRYFPLLYPVGIHGPTLALGLNRLFRQNGIPYTAHWGVPKAVLFETMEEMLRQDLPVIFSVGPNFPQVWKQERLFMRQTDSGGKAGVRAHYMVVTAMDEKTLTVSSWGRQYIISRSDYLRYIRCSSSALVSNLLWLRKKK